MVLPEARWRYMWGDMRHNPCLMKPMSAIILVVFILFWIVTMALNFPTLLLSFLLTPFLARGSWLVEFLYPSPLARWAHLLIVRLGKGPSVGDVKDNDKNRGFHSRTVEQRIEVIKDRVYIHPVPQLLDNLGYLVICCPDPTPRESKHVLPTPLGKILVEQREEQNDIVAFMVDCGDAPATIDHLRLVARFHYGNAPIQLHSILSTHKHHDHTAGNGPMKRDKKMQKHLKLIVGGAIENVPYCNYKVANGDMLPLPQIGYNDMNQLIEVEAIAVPAHTRGSIVYALRPKRSLLDPHSDAVYLFTGDTMFSGGSGVPFEAGTDPKADKGIHGNDPDKMIKTTVGTHAVERNFAEVIVRGMPFDEDAAGTDGYYVNDSSVADQMVVLPGHEYTGDLLARQFVPDMSENNNWKAFTPDIFFEAASHMFVAQHRRSLPSASGKLLAALSTIRRELAVNPQLRGLSKRAELVVAALRFWEHYFSKPRERDEESPIFASSPLRNTSSRMLSVKTPTKPLTSWTLDAKDIDHSVFTTVYTEDLTNIIEDLDAGNLSVEGTLGRLQEMKSRLKEPLIKRRPVPGTLQSEKTVHKGLIGMALLGSSPSGLSLSDSRKMKLSPPNIANSNLLQISKKRLITILGRLGFLEIDGERLIRTIHDLWSEAHEYMGNNETTNSNQYSTVNGLAHENGNGTTHHTNGGGSGADVDPFDTVELGALKWVLYGLPPKQPSWFSRMCMPCGKTKECPIHPAEKSGMVRQHGELVRHDIMKCPLCRYAAGAPKEVERLEKTTRTVAVSSPMIRRNGPSDYRPQPEDPIVPVLPPSKNSPQGSTADSIVCTPQEGQQTNHSEGKIEVTEMSHLFLQDDA